MEDLGDMPLAERRRLLLLSKRRPFGVPIQRASPGALKEWPGLPRGVNFNPSDADLLWHLLAKVGKGSSDPHPFIHEFITCLDEFDRFGCTHPLNLPGVKEDGTTTSYFFHKAFKTYSSENGEHLKVKDDISGDVCWQKSGKTEPLVFDGIHQGYKTVMTLHISMKETDSLLTKENFKGHWMMHQYHLGTAKVDEGEFVVSKIFPRSIRHANQNADGPVPTEDIVMDDHGTKDLQPLKGVCSKDDASDNVLLHERSFMLVTSTSSNNYRLNCNSENSLHAEDDEFVPQKKLKSDMETVCRKDNFDLAQMEDQKFGTGGLVQEVSCSPCAASLSSSYPVSDLIKTSKPQGDQMISNCSRQSNNLYLPGQRLVDQINAHEVLGSLPPRIDSAVKIEHFEEIFADNGLGTNGDECVGSSTEEIGRKLASFTDTVWSSNDIDYISRAKVKEETDDGLSKDMKNKLIAQKPDMLSSGVVSNSKCKTANTVNSQISHLPLRRKRKKTATDSVEQALEEDAPGLLEVLRKRGISADEMKLYGAMEDDEALEGDNFEELESVIHKIYSARASLFKFSLARYMKGSKAVYCVACLLSLVEQSRYMQFRGNRTEWGWCRDLQSFIFVFQEHNRIVLERPEYGYATYFFGIVDSLPIDWQIKRIVTAMKLTSCSRTTLIEDKPLVVGQDLTEGEARVLEEYGWTPNCGLGTMLDYRDRVVHDRKNEGDISEWRVKIGRMLADGLDSGRTVLPYYPKKFTGGRIDPKNRCQF